MGNPKAGRSSVGKTSGQEFFGQARLSSDWFRIPKLITSDSASQLLFVTGVPDPNGVLAFWPLR